MHCVLNGKELECYGYFLNHHVTHERMDSTDPGMKLIFVFEQGSALSMQIENQILHGQPYVLLTKEQRELIHNIWSQGDLRRDYDTEILKIYEACGLRYDRKHKMDERIHKILQQIHDAEVVEDDFLEQALNSIHLSKSRFLHLVKEQTGVSYKNLLLTEKFLKTWRYLAIGENITSACIHGGFTDSAHFANYMKKSFGLSTKQELQQVDQVIWVES